MLMMSGTDTQELHPLGHEADIWWPDCDYVEQHPVPTEDEPDPDKLLKINKRVSEQTSLEVSRCIAGTEAFYNARGIDDGQQWRSRALFAIQMILEEAFQNVHRHGNKGDPRKQAIFTWYIDEASGVLTMVFRDSGNGFDYESARRYDPTAVENLSKPGGRGMLLLKESATAFEHSDGGRCLMVVKNLLPDAIPETRDALSEALGTPSTEA